MTTIVIPMTGAGRRFSEAGSARPGYQLVLGDKSVFAHAVGSFEDYFEHATFIFAMGSDGDAPTFVANEVRKLGIKRFSLVCLEGGSPGQAETVRIALDEAGITDGEDVTVFNIDTFRPGFRYPSGSQFEDADGFIETSQAPGDDWSFVVPAGPGDSRVVATTERIRVSDYCSNGVHHFRRAGDFRWACEEARKESLHQKLHVAPLYNYLICAGRDIRFVNVPRGNVVHCSTREQFETLRAQTGEYRVLSPAA